MRAAALLLTCLPLVACGGGSTPPEMADPEVAPNPTNAAGDPYPSTNLGHAVGQVAPNLAFQGYPLSERGGGLKPVSLADFYDPRGKDHVILYVTVSASWCAACVSAVEDMKRALPTYGPRGVVMLEVLAAGSVAGYGPSLGELDAWVDQHQTSWTLVADERGRRVQGTLGLLGVPSTMLIDARTMEILHASSGGPDDLPAYLDMGLSWVASHPR